MLHYTLQVRRLKTWIITQMKWPIYIVKYLDVRNLLAHKNGQAPQHKFGLEVYFSQDDLAGQLALGKSLCIKGPWGH